MYSGTPLTTDPTEDTPVAETGSENPPEMEIPAGIQVFSGHALIGQFRKCTNILFHENDSISFFDHLGNHHNYGGLCTYHIIVEPQEEEVEKKSVILS